MNLDTTELNDLAALAVVVNAARSLPFTGSSVSAQQTFPVCLGMGMGFADGYGHVCTTCDGDGHCEQSLFVNSDHNLKIDPERLAEILAGTKTHEIRVFDRDYQVGHTLKLSGYNRSTNAYTGQSAVVKVTNITTPGSYGLPENIGVISIALVEALDAMPEVNMAHVLANNKQVYVNRPGSPA